MSEQSGFERATLERKDRAELASIAEALGNKPPSRARKSQIVDQILELVGVDEPGSDDGDSNPDSSPDSSSKPANGSASPAEQSADVGNGSGSESAEKSSESNEAKSSQNSAKSGGESRSGGAKAGGNRGAGSSKGDSPQGDSSKNDSSPDSDSADSDSSGSDSDSDDGGEPTADGGVDPEPGNRRRRRRRGRDRDRDSDPEWSGEPIEVEGLLDLRDDGYGFLRVKGFLPSRDDVYVSVKQCRQLGLRKGDHIAGLSRPAGRQEKNPALMRVERVNGLDPEQAKDRVHYDELTAVSPTERLLLSGAEVNSTAGRIIDLVAPIGKGQRGLIVTPPNTAKSALLRDVASCIESNNPDASLLVLLIDEKPEEVSEFERTVDGDVLASTFDRPADEHVTVAELTLEHARRLVEYGNDVVILLDGLTRLVRSYNTVTPPSGRTLGGTLDTASLYPAKWFFGSARSVEQGGSLTIIATIDTENGSAADAEILHEFSANANSKIVLNRRLAERRVSPAIDMAASLTERDDLLLNDKEQENLAKLRRVLEETSVEGTGDDSLEAMIIAIANSKDNDTFVKSLEKR